MYNVYFELIVLGTNHHKSKLADMYFLLALVIKWVKIWLIYFKNIILLKCRQQQLSIATLFLLELN